VKGKTARDIVQRELRFPTGHKDGYSGFCKEMKSLQRENLEAWRDHGLKGIKVFDVNDVLAAYQSYPPEFFAEAYPIADEDFDGELARVQRKYIPRFKNIRRAWARILQYLPETMVRDRKYKVLEMSTAHGASLEVLRFFGHEVVGNDYSNAGLHLEKESTVDRCFGDDILRHHEEKKAEWQYRAIVESVGLDVRLFDAGLYPYPFPDDEFDVVLCFDALEHYCHPRDWMRVVDEFTRVASSTVVVEINPVRRERIDDDEYMNSVAQFFQDVLAYSKRGFRCVATTPSFNQPRFVKLMRIA